MLRGHVISASAVAAVNSDILVLLAGTSFLTMIVRPAGAAHVPPRGPRAFATTLLGVHLFSVVINLPAMLIAGERMQRGGRLHRLQELLLSRAFSSAAFWSPFFAAMAVAIGYAPGSEMHVLVMYGLPPALAAQLAALFILGRSPQVHEFMGYPVNLRSLWGARHAGAAGAGAARLAAHHRHRAADRCRCFPAVGGRRPQPGARGTPRARATAAHGRGTGPVPGRGVCSRSELRALLHTLPALPRPAGVDAPLMAVLLLAMLGAAHLGAHPVIAHRRDRRAAGREWRMIPT